MSGASAMHTTNENWVNSILYTMETRDYMLDMNL